MNELTMKNDKFGELEIYVDENGKVWFPATEVAEMLGLKKTKKTYEDKLKAVEGCLRDTKEKIRIAENVREIREAGIGDQLPLFREAL